MRFAHAGAPMTLTDALALEAIGYGFVRVFDGELQWEPVSEDGHIAARRRQWISDRQPPRRAGTDGVPLPMRSVGAPR
jgi:hypothetical protein